MNTGQAIDIRKSSVHGFQARGTRRAPERRHHRPFSATFLSISNLRDTVTMSSSEASRTRLLAEQTERIAPLVLALTAIVLFLMLTNIGGFARDLAGWLIHNLVFADFLAFSFVLALPMRASEIAALIGAALVLLCLPRTGAPTGPAAALALGSIWLIAIVPSALGGRDRDVARLWFVVFAALLLPMASTLALLGQQLSISGPTTFDVPAYLTDRAYGFSASAILGGLAGARPLLHQALKIVYGWLPAAVSTCYVLNVRAGYRDADVLLKAALTGGAVAFVLYHAYPAAGPAYAFGATFPGSLPDPASLAAVPAAVTVPGAPRNCMPSVHFLWALLAAIEARRLAAGWRVVFALFAGLTALATLALGEHYVIDLVVAVPFTLALLALCGRERTWPGNWHRVALAGSLMTGFWFAFLRLWTPPPLLSPALWLLTAATLVGSVLLAPRRLSAISAPEPRIARGARAPVEAD